MPDGSDGNKLQIFGKLYSTVFQALSSKIPSSCLLCRLQAGQVCVFTDLSLQSITQSSLERTLLIHTSSNSQLYIEDALPDTPEV